MVVVTAHKVRAQVRRATIALHARAISIHAPHRVQLLRVRVVRAAPQQQVDTQQRLHRRVRTQQRLRAHVRVAPTVRLRQHVALQQQRQAALAILIVRRVHLQARLRFLIHAHLHHRTQAAHRVVRIRDQARVAHVAVAQALRRVVARVDNFIYNR